MSPPSANPLPRITSIVYGISIGLLVDTLNVIGVVVEPMAPGVALVPSVTVGLLIVIVAVSSLVIVPRADAPLVTKAGATFVAPRVTLNVSFNSTTLSPLKFTVINLVHLRCR